MAKKITAPHSYDPGKGRPKEYLAYLNEREMAYLRSINGNNMERGPRGLPSFPPKDAIGSSSNAPSKSPASSGVGRESSRGLGQGAGGAAVGRGPSGGSPSGGGNLGGGGKGPGGPSGPNSSPSRSGSPSAGGGGKGPGGPSGPNSAPSGTRGVGGPSSPMGGQGPSFSKDTEAQQNAQVRDAIKAVKNTPAFRNDAFSGGIRTLSVGPIGTSVNVGPRVAPTQNRTSVVGGWGVQGYNSAMPKAPSFASPTTAPAGYRPKDADQIQRSLYGSNKQIYDRVPIGKQFGVLGEGYDERIAPEPSQSTSISSQFPSYKYDSPLTPGTSPEDMARRAAVMNQIEQEMRDMGLINRPAVVRTGSPIDAGGIPTGGRSPGKTRGFSITSPAEAATPEPEEKILEVENYPERPTYTDGTYFAPENPLPGDMQNRSRIGTRIGSGLKGIADLTGTATSYTPGDYEAYRNDGSIPSETPSEPSGEVYGPKNVDPEVQEVMRDIDEKNKRGVKGMKATPGLGNVLKVGDAIRGLITGKKTTEADADLKRAYMQGSPAQQAELEAKYPNLTKFAQQAGLEPRLPMSNYESWRQRSFGTGGGGGGSTSTTSPGGGITDIGSGGKNEPPRISPVEKETPKPPAQQKEDGRRPAIYYKWDLGVDVPSPTDSDYTLYTKYLQEKAAAKAGFA